MTRLGRLYEWLYPRRHVLVYACYGILAGAAYGLGYLLRFEFQVPAEYARTFALTVPAVVLVRIVLARIFKLSSGRWRFIGTSDALRLFLATSAGTALLAMSRWVLPPDLLIPRSVLLIEWVLSTYLTAGLWISYRIGFEQIRHVRSGQNGSRKRVVIVGAGEAGTVLAREIQRFPTGFRLMGFVDDDPVKWGARLYGVDVIGGTRDLNEIVRTKLVEEIIVAVPSAQPSDLRELVLRARATKVPFKVLPGLKEVLEGRVGLHQIRELRIEDLLGREPIELQLPELAEDLTGQTVLITGAAGSIGSELSRQVALHRPRQLILLDQAETDLFFLEMELREAYPDLAMVAVVADVVDEHHMDRLFARFSPHRVFHAAAYKHVPLMETNVEQAVKNNVIGTAVVAEAAGRNGTSKFILVSTDKAVQPANVMGATKRLAELVVLDLQERYPGTAFGAVRFGNVLGSKGSVIPVFRRQIEERKPLTITHPDVSRYFMTIAEAVQLILQASLLPELRGHIAMLDMGEPVRILDLAENFLRLSGLPPRMGETYCFTGLRPGEKLHEELAAPDEGAVATSIPKVRILRTSGEGIFDLQDVERWNRALSNGHADGLVTELRALFAGLGGNGAHPAVDYEELLPAAGAPIAGSRG